MKNRDIIFPSFIILLCGFIFIFIGQFEEPMFQDTHKGANVNAQFFPNMIAILLVITCISLIIQNQLEKEKISLKTPIFSSLSLFGLGFLLGYAFLIYIIGYLAASLMAFTAYLIFFKVKKKSYYVTAWSFVLSIFYLFKEIFVISLPQGIIF